MLDERIAVEQLESWSKKIKKFLTNVNEYDNLNKLFQTAKRQRNLIIKTIDNNPENSKRIISEQTFNVEKNSKEDKKASSFL